MLNPEKQKSISKDIAEEYYNKMTAEVEEYDYTGDVENGNFMFDGQSFYTWNKIASDLGLNTLPVTIPKAVKNTDKKSLKSLGKAILADYQKIRQLGYRGFVRLDTYIDPKVWAKLDGEYFLPGMKKSLSQSYDKLILTDEMRIAQYFSPNSDNWIFYVQSIAVGKVIHYQVTDGVFISKDNTAADEYVRELVKKLIERDIRPRHPQMAELNWKDFTFEVAIHVDESDGVARLFDAHVINVNEQFTSLQ